MGKYIITYSCNHLGKKENLLTSAFKQIHLVIQVIYEKDIREMKGVVFRFGIKHICFAFYLNV
jgi:hypothetical protein